MRSKVILACIFLMAALGGPAMAEDESWFIYSESILPHRVQNNSVHFDPQVATAGTAVSSAAVNSVKPDKDCKPLSPCAMTSPALQTVPPLNQARAAHGAKSSASS